MHRLIIDRLGPIHHCDLQIKQYTVLTGFQASGKSTIAKAIFFFRTIKDDLYQLILRQEYSQLLYQQKYCTTPSDSKQSNLCGEFERHVRSKFLSTFGSSYSMDRNMRLDYHYGNGVSITLSLTSNRDSLSPNFVWVEYSSKIREFLRNPHSASQQEPLKEDLACLFDDSFETVYIPAGRSILTVLGSQFSYLYSTMDDSQKRLLDSCTRDYLERVMKLRPQFANGIEGLIEERQLTKRQWILYQEAFTLVYKILKGKYTASDSEERIWMDDSHYVKINFASSGQQEIAWVLNLLVYYLVMDHPVFFIIEEPESNLFPQSQKLVVELISLVFNSRNSILLTTHSPYVLGAVNNLLYAGSVGKLSPAEIKNIIPEYEWIDSSHCTALFVRDGYVENCMDDELNQIDNSLLDQISHEINEEYDELFKVEQKLEVAD